MFLVKVPVMEANHNTKKVVKWASTVGLGPLAVGLGSLAVRLGPLAVGQGPLDVGPLAIWLCQLGGASGSWTGEAAGSAGAGASTNWAGAIF